MVPRDGLKELKETVLSRHDTDSVSATLVLLLFGGALTALSRRWGVGSDLPSQLAALAGPVALMLGVGMAFHGHAMPVRGVTTLTRLWGIGGSVVATVNLWSLDYFGRGGAAVRFAKWFVPVGVIASWLLPREVYGETPASAKPTDAAEPPTP